MYVQGIIEATNVSERDAKVVEEIMRVESPTLDSLSVTAFRSLARRAEVTYRLLQETDKPTAAFYERQAGVE